MAEIKTKKNDASVADFIASIPEETKRKDSEVLAKLFADLTGKQPKMWGASLIGYGDFRYKYASGREGDWFIIGFSPRKQALSLYLSACMYGFDEFKNILDKLGRHSLGRGCLYIKKLSDINISVLKELLQASIAKTNALN